MNNIKNLFFRLGYSFVAIILINGCQIRGGEGGNMFGNIGIGEVIFILFIFSPIILWLVALVDILKSNFKGNDKIIWILVVIFVPIIGAILYLAIGKNQKINQ